MKDKWYGDNRDLVKWGILLELVKQYRASRIVQIAYYRPEGVQQEIEIEIDGRRCTMDDAVIRHFPRSLLDIARLESTSVQIEVFNSPLLNSGAYTKGVVDALAAVPASPGSTCIVFLDPDTGLEPKKSKPGLQHVCKSDLGQIWNAMRGNDLLVFYQHKTDIFQHKDDREWIEPKQRLFESALNLPRGAAKMARSQAATDVVFFFVQKTALTEPSRRELAT